MAEDQGELPQLAIRETEVSPYSAGRFPGRPFKPGPDWNGNAAGRPRKGESLKEKFVAMLEGNSSQLMAALESQLLKGNARLWAIALAHHWGEPTRNPNQLAEDDPALLLAKHLAQAIENGTEAALLRVKAEQAEAVRTTVTVQEAETRPRRKRKSKA